MDSHEKGSLTALLGRAKIRDLAHAVLIGEDVVGLHVAMEDAERVKVLESLEDLVCEELDDILLELGAEGERISPALSGEVG